MVSAENRALRYGPGFARDPPRQESIGNRWLASATSTTTRVGILESSRALAPPTSLLSPQPIAGEESVRGQQAVRSVSISSGL